MSEKEEDHRRKELALQEKHSRDLATKSQALAEEMAQQPQSGEGVTDEEGDGRGTLGVRGRTSSKVRQTKTTCNMHAATLVCLVSHLVASPSEHNTTITNISITLMIWALFVQTQESLGLTHDVLLRTTAVAII